MLVLIYCVMLLKNSEFCNVIEITVNCEKGQILNLLTDDALGIYLTYRVESSTPGEKNSSNFGIQ